MGKSNITNMKKKIGRPRKINYKPSISIDMNGDIYDQVLEAKDAMGVVLTTAELELYSNRLLNKYGITVKLTEHVEKLPWYNRVINWLKGKK